MNVLDDLKKRAAGEPDTKPRTACPTCGHVATSKDDALAFLDTLLAAVQNEAAKLLNTSAKAKGGFPSLKPIEIARLGEMAIKCRQLISGKPTEIVEHQAPEDLDHLTDEELAAADAALAEIEATLAGKGLVQ